MLARIKTGSKLLALVLLASCAPQWTRPKSPPLDATPLVICDRTGHLEEVRAAAELWDRALGNWRHMVATEGGASCNFQVVDGVCDQSNTALACTDGLGGATITVRAWETPRPVLMIAHELGHSLGAQHVDWTLMAPVDGETSECPDKTTVAQVAAYWRIDLSLLAYCY